MRQSRRFGVYCSSVFISACSLAWSTVAMADDAARAKELFDRGLEELNAGHYATACPDIAESLRLDRKPGTLFTLAACEMEWGHVVRAADRFDEYLRLYENLSPEQKEHQSERPKVAQEQRDKLRREISRLTLKLPPAAPSGTVVKLDGVTVTNDELGNALPVDPGAHEITTQVSGGAVRREKITIGKGNWRSVVVSIDPVPATPVSNSSTPPRSADRLARSIITGTENREVPVSMAMRRLVLPHLTFSSSVGGEYTRVDFGDFGMDDLVAVNLGSIALGLGGDFQFDADFAALRLSGQMFEVESVSLWGRSRFGATMRFFANEPLEIGLSGHVSLDPFGPVLAFEIGVPFRVHLGRFVRIDSGVFAMTFPQTGFNTWLAADSSPVLGFYLPRPGIPLELWVNPVPAFFIKARAGLGVFNSIEGNDRIGLFANFDAAIGGTVRLGKRTRLDIMGHVAWPVYEKPPMVYLEYDLRKPLNLSFPIVGLGFTAYFPLAAPTRPTSATVRDERMRESSGFTAKAASF